MFTGSAVDSSSNELNAYLIRKIGMISVVGIDPAIKLDWFYAKRGWQALDEAEKDFGDCEIVQSCTVAFMSH